MADIKLCGRLLAEFPEYIVLFITLIFHTGTKPQAFHIVFCIPDIKHFVLIGNYHIIKPDIIAFYKGIKKALYVIIIIILRISFCLFAIHIYRTAVNEISGRISVSEGCLLILRFHLLIVARGNCHRNRQCYYHGKANYDEKDLIGQFFYVPHKLFSCLL